MIRIENNPEIVDGYIIVPVRQLTDNQIIDIIENYQDQVISKREMIAMYTSTVLEINRGDNSKKSLNVKLYNCIASFAHKELDKLTNRILKNRGISEA